MKVKHKNAYTKIAMAIFVLFLLPGLALAGGASLKELGTGIEQQITSIANVLTVVAYVAGVGFALAGIIQFKAHKDNPVQVPLSKPIVYLVVGGCLLFLPTVLETAGGTIFGGKQEEALKKKFERQ